MKKIIQITFVFLSMISFAQNEEMIKERGNLSNPKGNIYKSLEVIDQRDDKKIGEMPFGDDQKVKEIVFPGTVNDFLSKWYTESNHKGGKKELVLVLKKLKAKTGETSGKETEADVEFSAQTFLKEGDRYSFLYKRDTVYSFKSKNISDAVVKNIPIVFAMFVKKTYMKKPGENSVSLDALADYESYVKNNSEVYLNNDFKDGIYLDHQSFLRQIPLQGKYVFERNSKNEVTRAVKDENGKKDKISAHEMFVYIENGKIYKHTFSGFMEVLKNEKGFYLLSNRGYVLPASGSGVFIGVAPGAVGMYTGAAVGLISVFERGIQQRKLKKGELTEIYIDPLTGEYDFSNE